MFGLIMLILAGIEILEAVKACPAHDGIHVEAVPLVAVIATGHKVIVLNFKTLPSYTLLGIGGIIFSLSGSCYLINKVSLEKKKIYQAFKTGEKREATDPDRRHRPERGRACQESLRDGGITGPVSGM